jgi:hypothetical protein
MTYQEAIEYLKSIGKIDAIEKELSTDGYTVVALAQHFKDKEKQQHGTIK